MTVDPIDPIVPFDSLREYFKLKYVLNDELSEFVRGVKEALDSLNTSSIKLNRLIWDEKCTDGLDSNILGSVSVKEYAIIRFQDFNITLYDTWKPMSYEEIANDIIKRSIETNELEKAYKIDKLQRSLKFLTGD